MHNLQCNEHRFRPMSDQFSSRIISSNGRPALKALMVPGSLNFGDVVVGTESAKQVVTLLNEGYLPLQISAIRWVGDFHVTTDAPANGELPVNGYCSFTVTYRPTADGNSSGALYVDTLNTAGNTFITLQGRGVDSTSGSGGGGSSFIPWVYNGGSANGGELTLTVTENTVGVPEIFINGLHQEVGLGFTFDPDTAVITLADQLEEGDEVIAHLSGVPANPDNPNIDNWHVVNWLYNEGSAIGGEQVLVIPYTFQTVVAVFKNGLRYVANLLDESFSFSTSAQSVTLTEALVPGDRVVVQIGGEFSVIEMSDRTLYEVARSANVPDSAVILSNDQVTLLNGKTTIYDVVAKKIWAIPAGIPSGATVGSISGSTLTYSPGAVPVTLVELADDSFLLAKQPVSGSILTNQHEINSRYISPLDAGAKGDGVTLDSAAFTAYEVWRTGKDVDLHGKSYVVTTIPVGNRYFNGKFLVSGISYDANYVFGRNVNNVVTALGNAGLAIPSSYALAEKDQFTYLNGSFFAGGAGNKLTRSGKSIAIGPEALGNADCTFDNIAIGDVALQHVNSVSDVYTTTDTGGTRNVAIGGNTSQFLEDAQGTVAIGRNAAVCNVHAGGMVAIGNGALGGYAVAGWDASITNFMPNNTTGIAALVAIGYAAGGRYQSSNLTAVGKSAATNAKFSTGLTCIGSNTGFYIEEGAGFNGKVKTVADASSQTYTQTGNLINVVCPNHTATIGGYAGLRLRSGGSAYPHFHEFPVQVTGIIDANTYQVTSPYNRSASGEAITSWFTSLTDAPRVDNMELIGNQAGSSIVRGKQASVIGTGAAQNTPLVDTAVIIGYNSANTVTTSFTNSVAVGGGTFQQATTVNNATAIGHQAGMLMQDGSVPTTPQNVTCLGYRAYVSGNNQIQLGTVGTAPYAYSALQIRSDERDKVEVRDTDLGIDFILGLRPVRGKWNVRDSYYDYIDKEVGFDSDGNPIMGTSAVFNEKDYLAKTKMGLREHDWFIAQEVEQLCSKLGVDFAGLHHAEVNGGSDVYSLGYTDFIPPMTKAIQQCWSRMDEQDKEIEALKERLSKAGL